MLKLFEGPGTALQLQGGKFDERLLVISHHSAYIHDYVSVSDDGGTTWTTDGHIFPLMDEAALTQLPNGSIMANMRHKSSPTLGRGVAVSNDGGITFGAIEFDSTLISPVCQVHINFFASISHI